MFKLAPTALPAQRCQHAVELDNPPSSEFVESSLSHFQFVLSIFFLFILIYSENANKTVEDL